MGTIGTVGIIRIIGDRELRWPLTLGPEVSLRIAGVEHRCLEP